MAPAQPCCSISGKPGPAEPLRRVWRLATMARMPTGCASPRKRPAASPAWLVATPWPGQHPKKEDSLRTSRRLPAAAPFLPWSLRSRTPAQFGATPVLRRKPDRRRGARSPAAHAVTWWCSAPARAGSIASAAAMNWSASFAHLCTPARRLCSARSGASTSARPAC